MTYDVSFPETLSEGVVAAVSTALGADPAAIGADPDRTLDPLYTVLDPDALDSLFRRSRSETTGTNGRVTFAYHSHEVTVRSDGRITVEPNDSSADEASD